MEDDEPLCACGRPADGRCEDEDKSNGQICNAPVCRQCAYPPGRHWRKRPEDYEKTLCRACQPDGQGA